MVAYYNENDAKAAAWLRELIKSGLIAQGDVDERSIEDIRPSDLRGYTQCHFFAGIGGWSLALRLAGWPDDRPVWTGSCPCQPFSAAGKGGGFADERHLWPAWFHLIERCKPSVVFGEQVASSLDWLDLVQADFERANYAFAAVDICSASIGAPHIRQRLHFVADTQCGTAERHRQQMAAASRDVQGEAWQQRFRDDVRDGEHVGRMEHAESQQVGVPGCARITRETAGVLGYSAESRLERGSSRIQQQQSSEASALGDTSQQPNGPFDRKPGSCTQQQQIEVGRSGVSFWSDCDWIECTDGKWRPVEPGTFPLAHGVPNRMGLLRGYGDAINPHLAASFVEAYLDSVS